MSMENATAVASTASMEGCDVPGQPAASMMSIFPEGAVETVSEYAYEAFQVSKGVFAAVAVGTTILSTATFMAEACLGAGNGILRLVSARHGAHLLNLPPEILTILAHKLVDDASALLSLSRTCRVLRKVTDDEELWVRCFHAYHQKILTTFFGGVVPERANPYFPMKMFFNNFSKHWKRWAMDRAKRLNARTRRNLIVICSNETRRSDFYLYKGAADQYEVTYGVYDVTNFFDEHPGGDLALEEAVKVRDASGLFSDAWHSDDARQKVRSLAVPGLEKLTHDEAFGPSIHRCHHAPSRVLAPMRRWGTYIITSWNTLLVVLVTATILRFNVDNDSLVVAVLDFAFDGPTVVAAVVGCATVRRWTWSDCAFPAMAAVVLALHCGRVGLELVMFVIQLYERPALPCVAIAVAWVTNRVRSRRAAARAEERWFEREADRLRERVAREAAQEAEARLARQQDQEEEEQPEMQEGSSQHQNPMQDDNSLEA